ncbi:hypothetical protein B0H14DRAFT_3022231 [Mycena olivaceomarginata]|nr:hypothetical protein B0H14DRAFT_3022231 [Mycena olivaceomarginata]
MPVALDRLHEDVLLRILVLTDIYTVLTVNSFFHALASTKQLWVFLIRDLFLRGLIDIPSDEVFTLSTDELVAEVKRAIFGPRTWSSNSSTTPTLIRQFTVPLESSHVAYESLISGGRYIMTRLIGVARTLGSPIAVDTRPGSKLTVALNINRLSSAYAEVLVLEVNLESGHSREITRFSGKFYKTQIADDYVCCICWWKDTRLSLLVDHRTEQYQYIAIEECAMTPPWNLHLVPGHIVLINPQLVPISVRNMTYELALTPTALFPVVGGAPISRCIPHYRKERVLLVKSLLRRHTYLLQGFDMVSVHQDPLLDFSEGQTPACTPVSTLVQSPFIGDVGTMNMYFSRAGYAVDGERSGGNCDWTEREFELDVGGHRVHHASLAHNGGLVVLHESGAEILYYD